MEGNESEEGERTEIGDSEPATRRKWTAALFPFWKVCVDCSLAFGRDPHKCRAFCC